MARQFLCSPGEPVVSTTAGKVRGFMLDGIYTFYGIPYAWAERFQMPQPVKPWQGVFDALSYGYVCPLLKQEVPANELLVPHRYWPMDEHCQNLNIWTPSLDPAAKKPVMVWLHGGGFFAGSSIEHVAYEGDHMSQYGDVVVVSLNHRLNILGYLDLEPFGEKYRNSCNAGNADMVAALQWIHDNIAAFGGDPDNVTLFGQSGGGMKIWTLMQTPAADGLFHKGIIQSGVIDRPPWDKPADGRQIVTALMEKLGLTEVSQLETVPYGRMAEAYNEISPALVEQGVYVGGYPTPNEFYLGDPRVVGFTEHARTIPILIGTVLGEFVFYMLGMDKYALSEEELYSMVEARYGDTAPQLIQMFKESYPDKNLVDLIHLDTLFRCPTRDFIEKKAAHPEAPTFSYLFTFDFPCDYGHIAWHCAEIPFVFHNTDRVPVCNVPGVSDRLEEQVFGAWIHFARYGNPGCASLPDWPACRSGEEYTMIFDRVSEVRLNHDKALMDTLSQHPNRYFVPKEQKIQH